MTALGEMRATVLTRDAGCVALRIDPRAGECADRWGLPLRHPMQDIEMDYVRHGATGARHELATDHLSLCPGHHRGMGATRGHVWATAHRPAMREYLDRLRVGNRRGEDDE